MDEELKQYDVSVEQWREYDFGGRTYTIVNPITLFMKSGGSMHRVLDGNGIVHCLPAPGIYGCVLRWKSKDDSKPVAF